MDRLQEMISQYFWASSILLALIAHAILIPIFRKLTLKWDKGLASAIKNPLIAFIYLQGFSYTIEEFYPSFETIRKCGVTIILLWVSFRVIDALQIYFKRKKFNKTTLHAVTQLMRIAALAFGGMMGLQALGIPPSALLAFGGAGGIVVGFAAKDLLSNFFGGLMIFFDRPFVEGDWIISPEKDIEGIVESIGWRLTRIRSLDKQPRYIPNALFSNIIIQNKTRMTHRRIKTTVGIRYQDASHINVIVDEINKMLNSHPNLDQKMACVANMTEFGDSSLNIDILCFTPVIDLNGYQEVQQDVLLKIMNIIHSHDSDLAFPTSTIHLEKEPALIS